MDVFTPNTGQSKNLITGEERAELRGRIPIRGDKGRFNGSKSDGAGGGSPKKGVDNSGGSGIIKATPEQRKKFIKDIKGTKAADGTVIQSMIPHNADRMIERGISSDTVKDVLSNPTSTYHGNKPNRKCVQKGNIRLVYETSGLMITAILLEDD